VWPPFLVARLPSRCGSGSGSCFGFFSSVMFLIGHCFGPRGDHHLAFAPICHAPQRFSNRDKGKPTFSRSVSLLTPHCPSDHIQTVVQRLPLGAPDFCALLSTVPRLTLKSLVCRSILLMTSPDRCLPLRTFDREFFDSGSDQVWSSRRCGYETPPREAVLGEGKGYEGLRITPVGWGNRITIGEESLASCQRFRERK
jgi:hypothetical protein